MIIHEFGHFIIAKKFGVKVEEFGIGYPPRIFGKRFGETLYSVNLIPFGAFVRIYGEERDIDDYKSFSNLAIWKRISIVLGGVIAFWLASAVIFSAAFLVGADLPIGDQDVAGITDARLKITSIALDSPAETSGLRPGDTIISVKNQLSEIKVDKIIDFQNFIQNNKGSEIILTLNRDGHNIDFTLTPRLSYPSDQGSLGIRLERIANIIKKYPLYQAPLQGIIYTGKITLEAVRGIYSFFTGIFQGQGLPKGAELAGPLGITVYLARAVDYGLGFFLYFIGSVSVLVALFNLFPIPALDGGKLLFLIIEKIKKRPIPQKIEQRITIIFFILLIMMSIFVTIRFDIPRVVDFWKAGL